MLIGLPCEQTLRILLKEPRPFPYIARSYGICCPHSSFRKISYLTRVDLLCFAGLVVSWYRPPRFRSAASTFRCCLWMKSFSRARKRKVTKSLFTVLFLYMYLCTVYTYVIKYEDQESLVYTCHCPDHQSILFIKKLELESRLLK